MYNNFQLQLTVEESSRTVNFNFCFSVNFKLDKLVAHIEFNAANSSCYLNFVIVKLAVVLICEKLC